MKRKLSILAAFAALLFAGGLVARRYVPAFRGTEVSSAVYYCPMHPAYTSDRPGDCPICNMKLVPREKGDTATYSGKRICLLHKCKMANCRMELPLEPGQKVSCPVCGTFVAGAAQAAQQGKPLYYRHPMRPEVTSPKPRKDEMGMDYVPVYAEDGAGESAVEGRAALTLSQERRQMIGLKSEEVRPRDLSVTVRATGRVAYDPDLYHAMSEYREAVRARERVQASPLPDVLERAEALVRSGRLRLRQLGLSEAQVRAAGTADAPPTNLLFGEKGGTVWVYAQVYEYEIGLVKEGQAVEVRSPAYPGRTFRGRVKAIDPILSAETRSLKVRVEVPNPEGLLKLEMYVNAFIRADLGRKPALPEAAVFDTGERRVAFVDLGEGRIEPREVRLGREADGYVELLSGVAEGERVVTSANFLIDSESRLKGAFPKAAPKEQEHRH
jgi:Cu(I)/Ag(I) efflux system membrane fusion protein